MTRVVGEQLRSPARPLKVENHVSKGKTTLDQLEEERQRVIALAHQASKYRFGVTQPRDIAASALELDTPFSFAHLLAESIRQGDALDTDDAPKSFGDESALLLLATVCCNEATSRELCTGSRAALCVRGIEELSAVSAQAR